MDEGIIHHPAKKLTDFLFPRYLNGCNRFFVNESLAKHKRLIALLIETLPQKIFPKDSQHEMQNR